MDRLSRAEYLERMEKASIVNTLDNLMTFPRLRKLVERGAVTLHGAYFGVATGELSVLDRTTGEFVRSVKWSKVTDLRACLSASLPG